MTIAYTTGQITLTNGSAVVTGIGTAWQVSLIAGGFIAAEADGNPLPIDSVDSDTSITAAIEWKGASGTYDYALVRDTAYLQQLNVNSNTLARLIAELDAGTIFKYDASGDLAGHATYDERVKGFSYLVFIGVDEPALYVKASATAGDWDGPFAYGTGPVGPMGPAGYANPRGTYSAVTAYARNDAVLYNGSSFVALQETTGNPPPTLPTTETAFWQLTAIKGTDGAGTGDVVGPESSVADRLAVFNGTTGKLIKDGGVLVSDLATVASLESALGVPRGRLTLTSGQAVQVANAIGSSTVYYTPYTGSSIPIWNGTKFALRMFSELSLALDGDASHAGYHALGAVMDIVVFDDAGTLRLGTGPAWANANLIGSGAGSAQRSKVGALWTNANTITVRHGNGAADTKVIQPGYATIVGSISFRANGQTEFTIAPAPSAGGTDNRLLLSNIYNREPVLALNRDSGTINFNVAAGYQGRLLGVKAQFQFLNALSENPVEADLSANISIGGAAGPVPFLGIGMDSDTILATNKALLLSGAGTGNAISVKYAGSPGIGLHTVAALCGNVGSGTAVINADIYYQFIAGMIM